MSERFHQGEAMSAPTLLDLIVVERLGSADSRPGIGSFTLRDSIVRHVSIADLRAVLLDQGATEMKWCELHRLPRADGLEEVCAVYYFDPIPDDGCRMVSVLVWRQTDSEQ